MPSVASIFKLLIVSSLLICFVLLTYTHYHDDHNRRSLLRHVSVSSGAKYILYWTGSKNFHLPNNEGNALFKNCKIKNCYVTENKELLPVEEYAAILFYIPTSSNHPKETPPARRSPWQRYIFASGETPIRFHDSSAQYVYNHFYNWTMTYRFDSDIVRRNAKVVKKKTKYVLPTKEQVRSKKRSVAWIVSNCKSVDRREQLAKNLAKHIDVDIYGKCGTLKCPEDQDCYEYVANNYRFYLSFENSHCRDYTTEKFFKTLESDIIPVVYGGGDYASFAPPRSYINVEDFDSAEILASYLKILEQDLDSYLEYFEWKRDYVLEKGGLPSMCKLCELLNDPSVPPKVYEDIKHWWFSEDMSRCKSEKQLPPIALEEP